MKISLKNIFKIFIKNFFMIIKNFDEVYLFNINKFINYLTILYNN